jgi:hypothetical protein
MNRPGSIVPPSSAERTRHRDRFFARPPR